MKRKTFSALGLKQPFSEWPFRKLPWCRPNQNTFLGALFRADAHSAASPKVDNGRGWTGDTDEHHEQQCKYNLDPVRNSSNHCFFPLTQKYLVMAWVLLQSVVEVLCFAESEQLSGHYVWGSYAGCMDVFSRQAQACWSSSMFFFLCLCRLIRVAFAGFGSGEAKNLSGLRFGNDILKMKRKNLSGVPGTNAILKIKDKSIRHFYFLAWLGL